ncbi:efflux RND transporter periplasmic adaptor subunit [Paenibacillus nasutitermitis]|uniref:MacA family efflux pump subunit n=1 Tax=Paenibacillus nasutitermitis TaxID=1652958 RepID=A0A917DZD1_9BACL|nr:efflux RND transporter periplasmic adaptor subunit [Paenibacillus nasutitermitis]GGD83040.1 MacA family efflux pump subunit [Paenibacillus nasutitermitis]
MKKKIKWLIAGVILIGISYTLYTVSKPAPKVEETMNNQAITFEVAKKTLVNTVEVKGKSMYEQETLVYAPFGSRVKAWSVEDGQQVKKGDALFRLDQTEIQNEITQQEAEIHKSKLEAQLNAFMGQLDQGTETLEGDESARIRGLAAKEVARLNQELSDVTSEIKLKDIAQRKAKLGEANFRSPASGIFLYDSANARPQAVTENQYVGKIVDLNKLQLIAYVGEQDIFSIKPGMPVVVKMTAKKELKLKGSVLKVSKFAKTGAEQSNADQAAQFEVVVALEPSEYLIAGLSLNGEIEITRKENVTVVPTIAVMREQNAYYVMLEKEKGVYERKDIKIGMETPENTEVLEGLKAGDTVILN